MRDTWHGLHHELIKDENKSAKEIFDELAHVHLNDEGFLIFDNTQKRVKKQIRAIDQANHEYTVHYEDKSSISGGMTADDNFLSKYTGFFRNEEGEVKSDGTTPIKRAKHPEKEIKKIRYERNCFNSTGLAFTYTDGSKEIRHLNEIKLYTKYNHFLPNIYKADDIDIYDSEDDDSPTKQTHFELALSRHLV